jgi:hypothetical protein
MLFNEFWPACVCQIEKMSGENESLRRTKYELETSLKNLVAEKDHIVNINEGLSIRHGLRHFFFKEKISCSRVLLVLPKGLDLILFSPILK